MVKRRCILLMAKKSLSYSFNGLFTLEDFMIEETKKDETKYYNLLTYLREFDNKNISITIKEDDEPESLEVNE